MTTNSHDNKQNSLNSIKKSYFWFILVGSSIASIIIAYVLITIFQHKAEAEKSYLRFIDVNQATTDAQFWGINWSSEYDQYLKTSTPSKTNFGGGEANPSQKATMFPFLTRMFAGYAFSIDYRDRRGHGYMLFDQEHTKRVTEKPQPGSCLHCHASVIPTYVRLGGGDIQSDKYSESQIREGFEKLGKMTYAQAHKEVEITGSQNPVEGRPQDFKHVEGAHPVSCTDCHNAKTMKLQVNRPGFVAGIRALKASQGVADFDVNRDATRSEMRSFVCAQCHVEYYCGPKVPLMFPWNKGTKVEQIESFYNEFKFPDGHRFFDWQHAETGTENLKAQHPEFEMWSQGIHAKSGVSCADCHMPYQREGAVKVSDHFVRSPLLMVNRACQQCHNWSESELTNRVNDIQQKTFDGITRAGQALTEFLDAYKEIKKPFIEAQKVDALNKAKEKLAADPDYAKLDSDAKNKKLDEAVKTQINNLWIKKVSEDKELTEIAELHRKGQWRLDFVAAENSTGFHAPQEAMRILAESIDYLRQAHIKVQSYLKQNKPLNDKSTK